MTRPNRLERLEVAITFQSSLTFAGITRSLPKNEASERCSNRVGSGLALKVSKDKHSSLLGPSSVMKEKSFITLAPVACIINL